MADESTQRQLKAARQHACKWHYEAVPESRKSAVQMGYCEVAVLMFFYKHSFPGVTCPSLPLPFPKHSWLTRVYGFLEHSAWFRVRFPGLLHFSLKFFIASFRALHPQIRMAKGMLCLVSGPAAPEFGPGP